VLLKLILVCALSAAPAQVHITLGKTFVVVEARGTVLDMEGKPLAEVTVQVYDRPEVLGMSKEQREKAPKQKLIAETRSDAQGAFSFPKLEPGDYEFRFTKTGWNSLSARVKFNPKAKPADAELRIEMLPAS
jgi:protocatechuate 3,4-dioxygenase beta subunit